MISIIVPVYNEEKVLSENAPRLHKLAQHAELIIVDGGSTDRSVELASCLGKILMGKKGRAVQMNYGAGFAQSNILFFLHADTFTCADTLKSIEKNIMNNGFIGGCLTQRIDREGARYRLIENFGNIRARLTKIFYGDQGIFVRKDIFSKIGGFPEVPIMEDIIFTKKLRRTGKTIVLKDKISVSARRWEKKGVIKTVLVYSFLNFSYWMKVSLNKISSFYADLR